MPLFEFHCETCDSQFETLVRNGEAAQCPECGDKRLQKLMSAPAKPAGSLNGLPIASACPPPEAGPCGTGCCRLPMAR